jgi:hypothetical protein
VTHPLAWSSGAVAAIEAVKPDVHGLTLEVRRALLGWILRTKPGESAIGRALQDPEIWPGLDYTIEHAQAGSGIGFYPWLQRIEARARTDGARIVGERHLLASLGAESFSQFGLNFQKLLESVRLSELGADFAQSEIEGRWHGLVDANVIVQYQPLEHINWLDEVAAAAATIWVTTSLLNELDGMKFYSESGRVRDKARKFTTWLSPKLDQALKPQGSELRTGVALRVWAPAERSGSRDTDHLESAFALRERGVPVEMVTADTGLEARAKASGVPVRTLAERWQLQPEPTVRDKQLAALLRQAQIEASPLLKLRARVVRGLLKIVLENDASGGEAREVIVLFNLVGGSARQVYDGSGNGYIPYVDTSYRATLRGTLPPGTEDPVAQATFESPPTSITYEIRASKEHPKRGRLLWSDSGYVDEQNGSDQPAA